MAWFKLLPVFCGVTEEDLKHEHKHIPHMHSSLLPSAFRSTRDNLAPFELGVTPSSTLITPSLFVFAALQTHLVRTIQGQTRTYAKRSLVFICCYAVPLRVDSHKLAVKDNVFFLDGGAPWSPVIPPRHLCRSCTASLWHRVHQTASKQHWPLQRITSAISGWIDSGGLCLSVRWRAKEGKETERKECFDSRLLVTILFHFMSSQSGCFLWVVLFSSFNFNQVQTSMGFKRWIFSTGLWLQMLKTLCSIKGYWKDLMWQIQKTIYVVFWNRFEFYFVLKFLFSI